MIPNPEKDSWEIQRDFWFERAEVFRLALIRYLLVTLAFTFVTFSYAARIVHFLERPLLDVLPPERAHLYFTGIADKFLVYFKISVCAAGVIGFPYLLFEIWRAIRPALPEEARRFAFPFFFIGAFNFALSFAFSYFFIMPYGYKYLIEFGSPNDLALITLTRYFSLTLDTFLAMMIIFEIPLVFIVLGKLGWVQAPTLARYRKIAYFSSTVVGAIISPSPDLFTYMGVVLPLALIYEVSIIGVRIVTRGNPKSAL